MTGSALFNAEDVAKALFAVLENKGCTDPSNFEDKYKILAFSRAAYSFRVILEMFLMEIKGVEDTTPPHQVYLLKINGKYKSANNKGVEEEKQKIIELMKEEGKLTSAMIALKKVDVYHILEDAEAEQRNSINLLTNYLIKHTEFLSWKKKPPS